MSDVVDDVPPTHKGETEEYRVRPGYAYQLRNGGKVDGGGVVRLPAGYAESGGLAHVLTPLRQPAPERQKVPGKSKGQNKQQHQGAAADAD